MFEIRTQFKVSISLIQSFSYKIIYTLMFKETKRIVKPAASQVESSQSVVEWSIKKKWWWWWRYLRDIILSQLMKLDLALYTTNSSISLNFTLSCSEKNLVFHENKNVRRRSIVPLLEFEMISLNLYHLYEERNFQVKSDLNDFSLFFISKKKNTKII